MRGKLFNKINVLHTISFIDIVAGFSNISFNLFTRFTTWSRNVMNHQLRFIFKSNSWVSKRTIEENEVITKPSHGSQERKNFVKKTKIWKTCSTIDDDE